MKAKIYTKTGDKGQTSLVGGTRVRKTHSRLEAYGTIDELNSALGMVRAQLTVDGLEGFSGEIEASLQVIQNSLFDIGSHLACEDEKIRGTLPRLPADALSALEKQMDTWETELPPLKNFILPGGCAPAAQAHVARTVCRRAERLVVRLGDEVPVEAEIVVYLNRLSDWLFLLAREFNWRLKIQDILWSKG